MPRMLDIISEVGLCQMRLTENLSASTARLENKGEVSRDPTSRLSTCVQNISYSCLTWIEHFEDVLLRTAHLIKDLYIVLDEAYPFHCP
jgi:hypothetical protein